MALNIVLIEPEIHTNTGNIGRLSLGSGSKLHLVKPLGFVLSDSRLKRAGLDYWKHLSLSVYENTDEFFEKNKDGKFAFFSSHGTQDYTAIDFEDELFLIFGKESKGLPKELLAANTDSVYNIPIYSEYIRSLNLANAVANVVYEGIRPLKNNS